jgi:hypothetical protein
MKSRNSTLHLRPGEFVRVRSENEILATLNGNGTLGGLPFTPEMRKYCRKKFKVLKRVKKIVLEEIGYGRMENAVILEEATCDGKDHEGCQRTCLFIWREPWLERIGNNEEIGQESGSAQAPAHDSTIVNEATLPCQSVGLVNAASLLPKWDFRQYVWDVTSGTYKPLERLRLLLASLSLEARKLLVGKENFMLRGKLRRTPTLCLNLQPSELVEVKCREDILATLDLRGRNRGLGFSREMLEYCGQKYRVLKRIEKMINERTGKMRHIANTVLLEGVTCDGSAHGGCPRNCYCLWREIWLKRVHDP